MSTPVKSIAGSLKKARLIEQTMVDWIIRNLHTSCPSFEPLMIKHHLLVVAALISLCLASHAEETETVIFKDHFSQPDSALANGWVAKGAVVVKNGAMQFQAEEEEFRPRAQRVFHTQKAGKVTVSFLMDWLRRSEGSWAFYIQLGNSSEMAKRLVYQEDLSKGVGVNLVWGGGEFINHQPRGSLGYLKDGKFEPLAVFNDEADKRTVVESPVITIEANVSTGTHTIRLNGKTYADLPFDHRVAIDTIRFVAHGCSASGFSKSAIDDVVVRGDDTHSFGTTDSEELASSPVDVVRETVAVPVVTSGTTGVAGIDNRGFREVVKPVLTRYCVSCHGPEKQKARLRYDQMDGFRISDRHLWTAIHEQLSYEEMPPEDEPQLSASEKEKVLAWIEKEQRALGTGSTRRLNRREFGAALQDVTGLDVDFSYTIPGDSKVDGFDTGAEALQDASDSVTQIMEVTRRAVEGIRFLEPSPSEVLKADLVNVEKDPRKPFDPWKESGIKLEKLPRIAMPGLGAMVEPKWPRDRSSNLFSVPTPPGKEGLMRVKLSVASYCAFPDVPNPILWAKIGGRVLGRREITGPADLEYTVQIEDTIVGKHGLGFAFTPRVEMPYSVDGFENEDKSKPNQLPDGAGLFRPAWDKKKYRKPEEQPRPFLVLKEVELEPHYVAAWPPAQWNATLGQLGDNFESADKLLALWMERAYRRPVVQEEKTRFLSFYEKLRADGMTFDDALRSTFQSVLMSPSFRYLESTAHEDKVVADHAIASRMSFMLVGAPPDNQLRKLASSGNLRNSATLKAQAERLLDDPRSRTSFLRPFVTQWLEMEQPITLVDDRRGKASYHFRRFLQDSMREETYAYIGRMLSDDRPARELVSSDWTMMNNTLARHYGYDGIEGGHLRKVNLRKDDKRGGGIMSHAGIQSMLCWMGDNWVIYRGAWAARHILNDPPQLPPLEVPELDATAGDNKYLTARELMALHREDRNCSVCHTKLDPIGFAFQNFDISGRWRDLEHEFYEMDELDSNVAWRGTGKTRPVDTLGELPGGETFTSYDEFKKVVVAHYQEDMVRGLMKNFMLYATGRKPDIDDMAEIESIMHKNKSKDYPIRTMLLAVFQTKAFLEN